MPDFLAVGEQPPGTPELLRLVRQLYDEDCVAWAGLVQIGAPGPVDWLLEHTLEGTRVHVGPALRSAALRFQVPGLTSRVNPDRLFTFECLSPLALAGSIAEVIVGGSPCGHRPDPRIARDTARAFADGLIGVHPASVVVLHSRAAWSDWFASDVWDRTWIVVDPARGRVWLLCLTGGHPPRYG